MRALDLALNTVWAMEPAALETLLTIAAREHDIPSPEALEAYSARSLANAEQAQVRDGVAILNVNGSLFKRANLFTAMSGATSYDILRRDLQAAVDNPSVRGILLNVDSPGGEASGVAELASAISAAGKVKPVKAYVNGYAASGGYWIAAAAGPGNVIVDSLATLGSIGAQIALRTNDDPKGTTSYRFVSSVSPLKNADPGTDEGAAHLQSVVDAMGKVFVSAVADYRGVAIETVLSDFGKGGIFVGQDAVKAGLADRVGNFEGVLAELSKGRRQSKGNGATMSDETKTFSAAEMQVEIQKALAAQAQHTAAVTALFSGFGLDAAATTAALASGKSVAELAVEHSAAAATARDAAIKAARDEGHAAGLAEGRAAKRASAVAALQSDEEAAAQAAASTGEEGEPSEAEKATALADQILADAGLKKGK